MLKNLIGYYTAALILEDNAGQVVVEKCQHGYQGGYLRVRNSGDVIFNEVAATDARIESSFVTMNRGLSDASFSQDPVLRATNSVVVFGNSVLIGSRAVYSGCQVLLPPGVAIGGHDSTLVLGAGTSIRGGHLGVSGGPCPIQMQAPAITGSNMKVIRDPGAFLGTVDDSVSVRTQRQPTLDGIVGDEVQGRMDFDLIGTPGSAGALIASPPGPVAPSPIGYQWASLANSLVIDVGAIDPMGHHLVSFTMPTAYPLGQPMVFQSLVLDSGALVWSTPSAIVRN